MEEKIENEDNSEIILNKMGLEQFPDLTEEARVLEIRRNKIKEVYISRDLPIEKIDASDNLIRSMEPFDGLKRLKILDLGYNLIDEVLTLDLPALEELYMMSNDIKTVEGIKYDRLLKLDVANNEIASISGIQCPNLVEGYFGANKIEEVGDITGFASLKTLDLQYNHLEEIDCSKLPSSLEFLLLNNNKKLRKIHNLDALVNLKMLGIKNTKLNVESNQRFEVW